ncbi:MAG: PAS domain S-box protein, partial [Desulfobulbaceae bacterium]|nr:PAS domain S-box protein [Desulfobulbaceae bacterium]
MNQQRQAVALQRESDENYRLILENSQEAIIIAQDLHLVMVNPAAERLTGFSAEQLMARPFLELMHPDDRELVIDRQQRRQRGEEVPVRYSFRVACLDGSFKWLEQHSSQTSWNGKPATLAVLSDITERRRAAQQLRLQAMVLDQIQDLVTITDLEGGITYVNEATARIHQRSKEELIGTSWNICGAGSDHEATRKEIVAQTLKQGHWRGEIVDYDHQGRPLALDCRTTLIHDADGQPVGICHIGADITHRREAEEQVRQSETALKAILNASPETIFLMEVNGTILAANESLCKRVQTSLESLVGSNVYSYLSPALAAARRQHVQQVVETRQPLCFRDQRNGLITEHYIYPVQEKGGDLRQLAVFAMDITGRVQMEEALRHSQTLLNATQRLSHVGGWEWDVKKQVMSWTDETYRIHGFDQGEAPLDTAELIRKSLGCYDAEDQPVVLEAFNRCMEHGQPYDLQMPFTAVDGRRLWVRTMAASVREGEQTIKVVGNVADITERKQRENLLLARLRLSEAASALSQEALLQKVLDEAEALTGSCIGFFHFLEKDQQTLALQVWSTSTLQSFCSAEGKGLHYSVDAAGVWVDCIRQRRPVIHNAYAELPHRKGLPPGHAPVVRELVVPIFRGEEIVAVFGVGNKQQAYDRRDVELVAMLGDMAWDIVLRKRAEMALQKSEENLVEAQKIARIGRWEHDMTTNSLTWSDEIFSLLEIDRQSFVPSYENFLEFVHPEDRALVDRSYRASVASKTGYDVEHRLLMDDGRIKWVNEIGRTEYDPAGHPLRSIGTVQDITRRKQTETA